MDEYTSVEWQTVGHEFAKQVLARQVALATAPHAYIFFGPEGVGKKTLAVELAEKLGAEKQSVLEFSFKDSNTEDLRKFLTSLSFKPSTGMHQVAILDSVELMHVASSNTLLKTLEEPTRATTLILISTKRNLPATILSRAQALGFGPLQSKELGAVALRLGLDSTEETINFSFGRVSELVLLARDKNELAKRKQWQADWYNLVFGSIFTRFATIPELAKLETTEIEQRLHFWVLQEMLTAGTSKLASRLSVLLEAIKRLSTNGNKKMVLEYVSLNLV